MKSGSDSSRNTINLLVQELKDPPFPWTRPLNYVRLNKKMTAKNFLGHINSNCRYIPVPPSVPENKLSGVLSSKMKYFPVEGQKWCFGPSKPMSPCRLHPCIIPITLCLCVRKYRWDTFVVCPYAYEAQLSIVKKMAVIWDCARTKSTKPLSKL